MEVILKTKAARFLAGLMLGSLASVAAAQTSSQDATVWLHRLSQASRTLNYSGLFVYQSGGHTETSRITHIVDGSGQQERLETVDASKSSATTTKCRHFFPRNGSW